MDLIAIWQSIIIISYVFYQNLLAHSKRGRRKHALLPDSLKFTAQHINSSSERQWIYGKKKTILWRKAEEGWACICSSITSMSRKARHTAKSTNIINQCTKSGGAFIFRMQFASQEQITFHRGHEGQHTHWFFFFLCGWVFFFVVFFVCLGFFVVVVFVLVFLIENFNRE